jgi:hypothetical protein
MTLLATSVSYVLVILDTSIVNVALLLTDCSTGALSIFFGQTL